MSFVGEYWRGEKPLWKPFWLFGVLGNAIIFFLLHPVLLHFSNDLNSPYTAAFVLCCDAFWVWSFVSIWKSSQKSDFFWRITAKFAVVLSSIVLLSTNLGFLKFLML